ncbi:hypothetical protein CUN37_03205 [Enterococcus faecium]|nr:hypothetical protein CUN37_03205 [Enterococcus faecium]
MVTASLHGIQKPVSRYSYKKRGCDKILVAAPYFLMQDSFFGNKPKFYKNLRSTFRKFLLIS